MKQPTLSNAGADTNLRILSMKEQAALRSTLLLVHEPPRKEWVGLTSEELATIVVEHAGFPTKQAQAISDKLKKKNT